MKSCDDFLRDHRMRASDIDMGQLVEIFTGDMLNGLAGKEGALRMIPTYIEAENDFLTGRPALAIDAGGTNFRAALIRFTEDGKIETGDIITRKMPGLETEISAKEFFSTVASYVKPLANKSERIGFCFSYPTEILPDRDGRLIQFCKEVHAPEVVGQLIGKNLLNSLGMPEKKIVLLNDTVATLLAGKSSSFDCEYDSFLGFILGTGTNTCYIESNKNILKMKELDPVKSQIINIESGNFSLAPRTDIDISFDKTTSDPGNYTFEKMISGGYFGGLSLFSLKAAASEAVFSEKTASSILALDELSSEEVNFFVNYANFDRGPLHRAIPDKDDDEKCIRIISCLIDRAAKMVAANLSAVMLKTGRGKSPDRPILITIEGSTYYKLHNLQSLVLKYLSEYLTGERERYYEFAEIDRSSLVGAALAALIS